MLEVTIRPMPRAEAGLPADGGVYPTGRLSQRRSDLLAVDVVLIAVVLWIVGVSGADPRAMSDVGLVSLFTVPMIAALAVLTAGFFVSLRRSAPEWVLAMHVVAFISLIHGTPAVLFGTLRYAWSWKHVGIIDYILRTGHVDTTITALPVYHNWPGFSGGTALLSDLLGQSHLLQIALWAQLALNLFNLLAMRFLVRSLTGARTVVWLAIWLFFVTSWLGLDYFSPQGLVFPLYMVLVGLVLRACRRPDDILARESPANTMTLWSALPIMCLVMFVISSSHQVTPLMMVLALATMFGLRRARGWYVPAAAVVLSGGWALVVARGVTLSTVGSYLTVAQPLQNGSDTLAKSASVRGGQVLVSDAGRYITALALVVAFVGIYRMSRRHRLDLAATLLLLSPVLLLGVTEYGGEVLFRVVLFMGPFVAYFAALAVYPDTAPALRTRRAVIGALLTIVLLPGFLLSYYGKDAQNYFTPAEVSGVTWLYENAQPGSLIVVGSFNFPERFHNYEDFAYLSIADEPKDSRDRVLADPTGRLARWLEAGNSHMPGYVLITRSQKVGNDLIGPMPVGSLDRVEQALRASPQFRVVFYTGDAVIFTLANSGGGDP